MLEAVKSVLSMPWWTGPGAIGAFICAYFGWKALPGNSKPSSRGALSALHVTYFPSKYSSSYFVEVVNSSSFTMHDVVIDMSIPGLNQHAIEITDLGPLSTHISILGMEHVASFHDATYRASCRVDRKFLLNKNSRPYKMTCPSDRSRSFIVSSRLYSEYVINLARILAGLNVISFSDTGWDDLNPADSSAIDQSHNELSSKCPQCLQAALDISKPWGSPPKPTPVDLRVRDYLNDVDPSPLDGFLKCDWLTADYHIKFINDVDMICIAIRSIPEPDMKSLRAALDMIKMNSAAVEDALNSNFRQSSSINQNIRTFRFERAGRPNAQKLEVLNTTMRTAVKRLRSSIGIYERVLDLTDRSRI